MVCVKFSTKLCKIESVVLCMHYIMYAWQLVKLGHCDSQTPPQTLDTYSADLAANLAVDSRLTCCMLYIPYKTPCLYCSISFIIGLCTM